MASKSNTSGTAPLGQQRIQIEWVSCESLVPADYNPNVLTAKEQAGLKRSLEIHGFVDPCIARREDRLLIGGHHRLWLWWKELGNSEAPAVFLDGVSDARAAALNVALNNKKLQGTMDKEKLSALLGEYASDESIGFDAFGYSGREAAELIDYAPLELPNAPQAARDQITVTLIGPRSAFEDLMDTLTRWGERDGLTVSIV